METVHKSVLLHEVIRGLVHETAETPWYLDGTLGGAGHALALAKELGGRLKIIGFDRDPVAVERDAELLSGKAEQVVIENEDYRKLDSILAKHGIEHVDMILLDLGLSSDELENSGRGFSFLKDEPLLMTMGDPEKYPFTAKDIVNSWEEETLANIIFGYSEDRFARRIARAIVAYRDKKQIETSTELAEIVKSAVPAFVRRGKIHPATKTFQALRIAVNDEFGALRDGLKAGYEKLRDEGRMAVISFHSLEDRIVKDFYKEQEKNGATLLTKKPIAPSAEEIAVNPRSRSAKLRIIEKHTV